LTLNPTVVAGGASSIGTVTLSALAPTGGIAVNLSSSHPYRATVPSAITIPAGSSAANFIITTTKGSKKITATITASQGSITKTATLTVNRR
jgi:hypothetical protein